MMGMTLLGARQKGNMVEEVSVTVALLSGEGATLLASLDWTVNQLRLQAQSALGVGIMSLVDSSGAVLPLSDYFI